MFNEGFKQNILHTITLPCFIIPWFSFLSESWIKWEIQKRYNQMYSQKYNLTIMRDKSWQCVFTLLYRKNKHYDIKWPRMSMCTSVAINLYVNDFTKFRNWILTFPNIVIRKSKAKITCLLIQIGAKK
jgi:hypothetical protein